MLDPVSSQICQTAWINIELHWKKHNLRFHKVSRVFGVNHWRVRLPFRVFKDIFWKRRHTTVIYFLTHLGFLSVSSLLSVQCRGGVFLRCFYLLLDFWYLLGGQFEMSYLISHTFWISTKISFAGCRTLHCDGPRLHFGTTSSYKFPGSKLAGSLHSKICEYPSSFYSGQKQINPIPLKALHLKWTLSFFQVFVTVNLSGHVFEVPAFSMRS